MDFEELWKEKTIKQLYNGEIYPSEQIKVNPAEARPVEKEIEKMAAEIAGCIDNGTARLEKLGNLYFNRMEQETQAAFTYGLKLGLRLMAEAARD